MFNVLDIARYTLHIHNNILHNTHVSAWRREQIMFGVTNHSGESRPFSHNFIVKSSTLLIQTHSSIIATAYILKNDRFLQTKAEEDESEDTLKNSHVFLLKETKNLLEESLNLDVDLF